MTLVRRLRRHPASVGIAAACVLTFALQLASDPLDTLLGRLSEIDLQYAYWPAALADEPWRAGTAVFLHIAPWHLFNNVVFVLLLGSWLEKDVGSVRVLILFVAGAVAGDLIDYLLEPDGLALGASAGLMAIAGAALVMERKTPFARQRQWVAGLSLVTTIALGLTAPAISALDAHAAGALAGLVLGLALPAPVQVRARNAAETEAARTAWEAARATIVAAPPDQAHLDLRPTARLTLGLVVLAGLLALVGASTIVQAGLVHDSTSASVAVIVGVWTAAAGLVTLLRFRSTGIRFDIEGFRGPQLKKAVSWSEIESLYPGRLYSGLAAMGGIGFVRRDGTTVGIRSAGHPVRPLAAVLEGIRLAARDAAED